MMNCRDWEERIALHVGGDLTAEEVPGVERHLAECAGCRELWSGMKESLELLRGLHTEPLTPGCFTTVRGRVAADLALPVMAQFEQPERVQKLITLKYADAQSVGKLIQVFGLDSVQPDNHLKVISFSGSKARVASAEEAIKQLDVPSAAQKNIELTV